MQQQLQPQALPNNSESLEAPLSPPPNAVPSNSSHLADEDGGGPSTSASSAKKRKPRSSSWSPAKKKHTKGKEKEFLIAPPLLGSAPLPAILAQGGAQLATGGPVAGGNIGMVSHSRHVGLLPVQSPSPSKQDKDGGRTLTNGSGVVEDAFGPVTASMNLSGKQKKTGKKERERERVKRDLLIGKSVERVEEVGKLAASRGHAVDEKLDYEDDHVHERDNDDEDDEDDAGYLDDLSILQPPPRRKKGKDVAHIHNMAGIAGGGAYKSTPGSPKRRREFDDIHVDQDGGGGHGHGRESLGAEDVEDNAGCGGGVPDIAPDGSIDKKQIPTKRVKGLTRVRSVPELGEEEPTLRAPEGTVTVLPGKSKFKNPKTKPAASSSSSSSAPATTLNNSSGGVDADQPRTKHSRLIALAKKLRQFFPDQRQELRRITVQLERQAMGKSKKRTFLTSGSGGSGGSAQLAPKSMPIFVPSVGKSRRTLHHRTGSESTVVDMDHLIEGGNAVDGDGVPEIDEDEDEELDPRGRPAKKNDVLIHVFIDQLSCWLSFFLKFCIFR